MITTTNYYKTIERNEPNDFEAMVLDSIECLKDRQPAYAFNKEQVEAIQACVNEPLTVDEFDGYFGIYHELNKKAFADYRKENQ